MLIVKLGGGDLDLDAFARDLAEQPGPVVVLHGANRLRDQLAHDLGKPPRIVESVSGFTSVLSDDDAVDMLMAAYAGVRNKRLVEALRRAGVNALGLTGLDGGLITGEQTAGIRVRQEGRKLLLRDQSGKARAVNRQLLHDLLRGGYTPVITVPIAGEDGSALNTENDDVLALVATELSATEVVSLIEAPGLLADPDDPSSLVARVDVDELEAWEERVSGRMRRKIRALRTLFERAPAPGPRFHLADGRVAKPITDARAGRGTLIARKAEPGTPGEGSSAASPEGAITSEDWLARQGRHELDVYGKRGIALVSGKGAVVRDAEGRAYLDCIGGHGALPLGHDHPALMAALQRQAGGLWFTPGSFASPPRAEFLERLHAALPPELDRTFLSNSGTEAVEAAMKIARAHTKRPDFLAAVRGFHGRTLGALSLTFEAHYREAFEPLVGGVRRVPFNRVEALTEAMDGDVAAVVLEPVQGEGGVHVATPEFLEAAREACDAHGALLVFDEVQTGFGRTGALFAFEHSGVVPDVLCLSKGIAGGLPLGATVVRRGIELATGLHGSTFGGNPIAVAVASATLETLTTSDLVASAERKGRRIADRIREAGITGVREVRQIGLMIGIQLRGPVRPWLAALQANGLLALSAGSTVLRLLPPLVISDEETDRIADLIVETLSAEA